ncbi:MAG: VCBS repeat-containing protein [Magnetococcales bacterium]|nr:VCBS repeat-containing protein [Nitrospirota bacterium]
MRSKRVFLSLFIAFVLIIANATHVMASCSGLSVNPTSTTLPSSAGSGLFDVTAASACTWTATTTDSWITITSPSGGVSGNGTVNYTVTKNFDSFARTGKITVSGVDFTITQEPTCTPVLTPWNKNFSSSGGNDTFTISGTCSWFITTADPWITITSATSGSGNGTVNYSVAANTGSSARTGYINVGGSPFKVTQDPATSTACTVSVNPTNMSFSLSGGSGSFNVTAASGCTWTAATSDTWVTITSGVSGTGNGTVAYTVATNNTGNIRTGVINVGGAAFTITQDTYTSTCTLTLNPTNKNFSSSSGGDSFTITASGGTSCPWNATTNDSWITITSGNPGNGNGTVAYSVASNTGSAARTGIINVAGVGFTITQDAGTSACTITLNPTNMKFPPSGGNGSFGVTSNCPWTASTTDSWIAITSGSSGSGNGTVAYSVSINTTANTRTGTIYVSGVKFIITQDPSTSACAVGLSPTTTNFLPSGGTGSFSVNVGSGCTWNASTADYWVTITSANTGTGNGTIAYSVAANTGTTVRTGIINVSGAEFKIIQDPTTSTTCTVTISPTSMTYPSSATSGSFNVTAASTCTWTATTADSWVTITSGVSGTGNGTVNYSISDNTGTSARTGIINLPGAAFTIVQDASTSTCTITLNPTYKNSPNYGGSDYFDVNAPSGCTWTAATADSWVTITSGTSGAGNRMVNYTVTQNTDMYPRTGIINVAGGAFTIIQEAATSGCMTTISPVNMNYSSAGGSGSINVTGTSGCTWTAATADSWVTITAGTSGSGNGTVSYTVAANTTTEARTGIINVAGVASSIIQQPPSSTCGMITLSPASKNFASAGGNDSIGVTADSGCAWTAASSDSWITITSGNSGSGSGTVDYTVAENTNTTSRTGSMTIGGQIFTVMQDAASACIISITPMDSMFQAYAGSDVVNVMAGTGCTWTAVSNDSWITITAGSSGSGNSTISYSVAENTGASSRSGTITVTGQTFTVTQLGTDCATGMAISPVSRNFASTEVSDIVNVATPNSSCTWTAASNVSWISITSASSGTGNGTVNYTVAENTTTSKRTGTMTIAGQTFTVNQEAPQTGEVVLTMAVVFPEFSTVPPSSSSTSNPLQVPGHGVGYGVVTLSNGMFSWSHDGKVGTASIKRDKVIVLSAQGKLGATIKGWTGCDLNIGTNQCVVKMTSNKKVTVEFSIPRKAEYDFDGDGNSDVLWRNSTSGDVYVWLMDGKKIKGGGHIVKNTGQQWDIKSVGDFNGDGRADLLWQNSSTGDVYIYIMKGAEISTGGFAMKSMPNDWEVNAVGDFDGDGKSDIMWRNTDTGNIYVWLMNGTKIIGGGYIARGIGRVLWNIKFVADLNGDNKSDVIWQNSLNGDVFVWLLDGLAIAKQGYAAKGIPKNWKLDSVSDFDGDGRADILWHEVTGNDYAIWFMNGVNIRGGAYANRAIPNKWSVVKAGDYDGDGKADLLWRASDTGDVYLHILKDGTTRRDEGFVANGIPAEWQTR